MIGTLLNGLAMVISAVFHAYTFVVLAACIVTWFNIGEDNAVSRILKALTEPVFSRVRKLPFMLVRGIDFSPILVLVVLEVLKDVIVGGLRSLGA